MAQPAYIHPQYVSYENESYRISGSRVSLDSVIHGFLQGETAETIAQNFPVLNLEQVYGAIAFYLANRESVDEYLENGDEAFVALRRSFEQSHPGLRAKLLEARSRGLGNA